MSRVINAAKLDIDTDTEEIIGTEDLTFADKDGHWYWLARGTSDCVGPFSTLEEAAADYEAT